MTIGRPFIPYLFFMAYEMKEGDIIIFLEPKVLVSKKTGQPFDAYTGKAKLGGIEHEVFCFKNEKEGKKTYLSGTIKPRNPDQPYTQDALTKANGLAKKPTVADDGEVIPF